jgi:hypothetical protein
MVVDDELTIRSSLLVGRETKPINRRAGALCWPEGRVNQ